MSLFFVSRDSRKLSQMNWNFFAPTSKKCYENLIDNFSREKTICSKNIFFDKFKNIKFFEIFEEYKFPIFLTFRRALEILNCTMDLLRWLFNSFCKFRTNLAAPN